MKNILKHAFLKSVPVLVGYVFLGAAFGILLQQAGYNFIWAFFISLTVYAGSGQFLLVNLLSSGASLATVAFMTLLINSRHIFYGLSFVDKFKKMKKLYPYMVFSLTDETYSVLCSLKDEKNIDNDKVKFFLAFFNQCYWLCGSVIGALAGQLISLNFKGIDFSMTALFVIIFIEQWMDSKSHIPAIVGLISSTFFLVLLGPTNFILPSLIVTVMILMSLKRNLQEEEREVIGQ